MSSTGSSRLKEELRVMSQKMTSETDPTACSPPPSRLSRRDEPFSHGVVTCPSGTICQDSRHSFAAITLTV